MEQQAVSIPIGDYQCECGKKPVISQRNDYTHGYKMEQRTPVARRHASVPPLSPTERADIAYEAVARVVWTYLQRKRAAQQQPKQKKKAS